MRITLRPLLAAALLAALALFGALGAAGASVNAYTANALPTVVTPFTTTSFTVRVVNDPGSPDRAQRARIGIAAGFSVEAATVSATTTATGSCVVATWIADGALIADGRINLKKPGGGQTTELCPGATLTVTFTATAPAGDATGTWTTELLRDVVPFALNGTQPTVRVDGTPPVTTIQSAPPDPSNVSSASFAFSAGEAGVTFACRLDGAPFAACSSPKSYAALPDGDHEFEVRAADPAGNTGPIARHAWSIGTAQPLTSIDSTPADPSPSRSATFTFSTRAGGAMFECQLDGSVFAPCGSPYTYADLADGSHRFLVRATDGKGHVGSPAGYAWRVDTVPPVEVRNARVKLGNRTVELGWTLPSDADFDHVSVSRIETGRRTPATAVYTGRGTAFTDRSVVSGRRYTYRITTHDNVGNGSTGVTLRTTATALLYSPARGVRLTSPPVLRWVAVRGATYYNVQLWYLPGGGQKKAVKGVKILSVWPSTTKLRLQRRWTFEGNAFRLLPGRYQWYVWPGFGKRSAKRYGQLLGESTFTVNAKAAKKATK
jgi:hypothetical protein